MSDAWCCGSDIKTWAKIIAIVGIILSTLSLFLSILFWIYIPFSISLLIAFILVLTGLNRARPGSLMAALVILGINIGFDILITIGCIYFAITVPQELIDDLNNSSANVGNAESDLRIVYSVFAVVLLVIIGMETFAFIIFRKARSHLIQNPRRCSVFPVTFSGHPHSGASPVYISSPPYPTAAPPYSAAPYPSGYVSHANPPMYPQSYYDNPNLPPRGYNIDYAPSPPMYPHGYPMNSQNPSPIYNMNPVPQMHLQNNTNNDSSPTVYQNESPNKTDGHW